MNRFRATLTILHFIMLVACKPSPQILPNITNNDIQVAHDLEETFQYEINEGEIIVALESENDSELGQRGFIIDGIIAKLLDLALPKHFKESKENYQILNDKKEAFAEYKGIFGSCYQFRYFYKYKDSRVDNVEWASSILTLPTKDSKNISAGLVLAPTLDGFTPIIESGLWLKLCRKGLATLMPESLYRKSDEKWEKVHFDPTPPYKSIDEYTLYEDSIHRYELVLKKNIEILRSFDTIMTDQDDKLSNLNVMSVNPRRVGFWGSSFGAVVGSLLVAKDSNIKAAVLTVGGGDLPYVVAHSKISLFKDTRNEQMKLLGLTSTNDYQSFISNYIKSDPLFYAKKSDAHRIYMILADKDTSVPTQAQYELYEKLGRPQRSRIQGGHILTLLFTSWFNSGVSRSSINSILEKLEKEPLD